MRLGIALLVITIIIPLNAAPYHAEAAPITAVGIYIEKPCQLSKNCVSYNTIKSFDTTPKKIFGELVTKGMETKRVYTAKQNNPEWLRFYNFSIIVDPPSKVAERIKMITIKTQLDQFIIPGQYTVKEYNHTNHNATIDAKPTQSVRYYSHSWNVDKRCTEAQISGKNWKTLLPNMIEHLKSDCKTPMPTDNITADIKPYTKHDISKSYKAKDQKWRDQIIKECTKSRNACMDLQQPTRGGL